MKNYLTVPLLYFITIYDINKSYYEKIINFWVTKKWKDTNRQKKRNNCRQRRLGSSKGCHSFSFFLCLSEGSYLKIPVRQLISTVLTDSQTNYHTQSQCIVLCVLTHTYWFLSLSCAFLLWHKYICFRSWSWERFLRWQWLNSVFYTKSKIWTLVYTHIPYTGECI